MDLLERCLGQREVVIWRALGENWLNPNVREPHDVAPYSPRFHKSESFGSKLWHRVCYINGPSLGPKLFFG